MKQGKYEHPRKRRRTANKSVALLLALTLAVGCAIGGTVAWLTAESETVTNTFTESDIDITLTETGVEGGKKDFKMIPGWTITKDPKVTLKAGSEACYLFVMVDENLGNWGDNDATKSFKDYLDYTVINTGENAWTAGTKTSTMEGNGVPTGVYYIKVDAATTMDTVYQILKDNKITVSGDVTKEMMDEIDEESESKPALTFTAYASQLYKNNTEMFTAAEAWANVNPSSTHAE